MNTNIIVMMNSVENSLKKLNEEENVANVLSIKYKSGDETKNPYGFDFHKIFDAIESTGKHKTIIHHFHGKSWRLAEDNGSKS